MVEYLFATLQVENLYYCNSYWDGLKTRREIRRVSLQASSSQSSSMTSWAPTHLRLLTLFVHHQFIDSSAKSMQQPYRTLKTP